MRYLDGNIKMLCVLLNGDTTDITVDCSMNYFNGNFRVYCLLFE